MKRFEGHPPPSPATPGLRAAALQLLAHAEPGSAHALGWRERFELRSLVVPLGIAVLLAWAAREVGQGDGRLWNWFLLPGALAGALSVGLFALRFRLVMAATGIDLARRQALRITTLATFYHFFVPLAAGADLTKFVKLRGVAPAARPLQLAGAIVLDHVIGLVTLLVMALVLGLALAPASLALDPRALGVAVIAGACALVVMLRRRGHAVAMHHREAAREPLRRRELLAAILLSALMQCALAAAVWIGSRGWAIEVGYLDILLVLTTSLMLQAIPCNLAGVGAADLAGTGLYLALGLTPAAALLLVSLLYCYRLLAAVGGGLWDLLAPRA